MGDIDQFPMFPPAVGQAPASNRTGLAHARRENSLPRVVWLVCKDESVVHGALLLSSAECLATDQHTCYWIGDAFVELQSPAEVAKMQMRWKSSAWHLSSELDMQLKRGVAKVGGTIAEHMVRFAGKQWHAIPLPQAELRRVVQAGNLVQFATPKGVCRALGVVPTTVSAITNLQAAATAELESFDPAAAGEHIGNKSCIVPVKTHPSPVNIQLIFPSSSIL